MRFLATGVAVIVALCASGHAALAGDYGTPDAGASWTTPPTQLQNRSFDTSTRWVSPSAPATTQYAPRAITYPSARSVPLQQAPLKIQQAPPKIQSAPQNKWGGVIAAYFWGANISGTSYVDGQATDIDIAFSDLFDKLDYALLGYAELRYDRWSFAIDASTLGFEASGTTATGAQLKTELQQTLIDLRLGFAIIRNPVGSSQWGSCCYPRELTVDAVVGARYWDFGQELTRTAPAGAVTETEKDTNWWDPYLGARLRWPVAKRWSFGLYGDVGGFGIEDCSELTWQVQATLNFHVSRAFFLTLGYRALGVDRTTGTGATLNGINATYHGPMLGLGFAF